MTDIFTSIIISACVGASGSYNPACQKALQSAYIQSGFSSTVQTFQTGAMAYGKTQEKLIFGKNESIVNTTVATAIVIKNKKADLSLPTLGLCDRLSTQLQPNSYGLKLEWRW